MAAMDGRRARDPRGAPLGGGRAGLGARDDPPPLVAVSSIPAVTPILASAAPVVAVMAIVAVPPLRAVSLRAVAVVLAHGASATFALPLTG